MSTSRPTSTAPARSSTCSSRSPRRTTPTWSRRLETEFDDVDKALEKYEKGDGYVSYDTVTQAQRKALTDVVNALAEPLSKLGGAIQSDDSSASPSS